MISRAHLFASAIFLFVLAIDLASPITNHDDSRWNIPTAISIERHGDIDIEEYRAIATREKSWSAVNVRGKLYNVFPYGASVLAAPIVAVVDIFSRFVIGADIERLAQNEPLDGLDRLVAGLTVAATAVFVFLIALLRLKSSWLAAVVALVFAFGTTAWSVASRAYWMHGPSMMLLAASLYVAMRSNLNRRSGLLLGLLLGAAFVVRPTNALSVIAFAVWLALTNRSTMVFYLVGLAAIGTAYVAINLATVGAIVPGYSHPTRLLHGSRPLVAMVGLLVSPARGLFIFSPIALIALAGVVISLRSGGLRAIEIVAIAIILSHWLVVALYWDWWGGFSFGPRYWTDVLPFFALLALPAIEWMSSANTGITLRLFACGVCLVLVVFSIWVHAQGALRTAPHTWNDLPTPVNLDRHRLWDWSDIQFLR